MKVELGLETVTPLFLAGAEPNQGPELRPASFRGALRYWYRALMGGISGNNLQVVRQAEAHVFGTTEVSSAVAIRLQGTMNPLSTFRLDKETGQQGRSGHDYLYYSTRSLGENNRRPFAPRQSANRPGVTLLLSSRMGAYEAELRVQHACAAAWLLTHLGGLGMRARRCAGSLQVVNGGCDGFPAYCVTAQMPDELQTHLATGIRAITVWLGTRQPPSFEFDVLHPDVCRVWVLAGCNPWGSWKEAVEAIGSAMQRFRAGQGNNRNERNSIFGLPIFHGPPNHDLNRRASPLWLRVTKLANGNHVGVATLFKADFKPGEREVGGGYPLIEQFIATFPTSLEVVYA